MLTFFGAIVGWIVVGRTNSGKSFLMNQLLGKQKGFELGPTVKPKTTVSKLPLLLFSFLCMLLFFFFFFCLA